MREPSLLFPILLVLSLSTFVVTILSRFKIPPVCGLILTGILLGPSGFSVVVDPQTTEILSELGIVFLLFLVGLQFPFHGIRSFYHSFLFGGSVQFFSTGILFFFLLFFLFRDFFIALFGSVGIACSSTTVTLETLTRRDEGDTPHGRAITGILIFQDLAVILFLAVVSFLKEGKFSFSPEPFLFLLFLIPLARYGIPFLYDTWLRRVPREMSSTVTLVMVLGMAELGHFLGFSYGVGAFLGGVLLGGSLYAVESARTVLPIKSALLGFFFVTLGFFWDWSFVFSHLPFILFSTLLVILLKGALGFLGGRAGGLSFRHAYLTGVGLISMGEFTFLLFQEGMKSGFLPVSFYQQGIAVTLLTLFLFPLLYPLLYPLSFFFSRRGLLPEREKQKGEIPPFPEEGDQKRPVLVIGYGFNGRSVVQVLRSLKIPVVVVETNPEAVREGREKGIPILYGDASHPEVLRRAGVKSASLLIVAISDPYSTREVVRQAKRLNRSLPVIVRVRYLLQAPSVSEDGVEVVAEEFETALQIVDKILTRFGFSSEVKESALRKVREEGYRWKERGSPP